MKKVRWEVALMRMKERLAIKLGIDYDAWDVFVHVFILHLL